VVADIHCVTGWSRLAINGRAADREILDRVKPNLKRSTSTRTARYGYTTSVPLAVLEGEENLLCYAWNGSDLTPEARLAVRLFVPSKYFWKSASGCAG